MCWYCLEQAWQEAMREQGAEMKTSLNSMRSDIPSANQSSAPILNYDLAPRPEIIFGCMMPAPWCGAIAGLVLAFAPTQGLPDRFSPLVLSLTHLIALGMLVPIMIGALFQLFPVLGGQHVRATRYIAPFVALGSATVAGLLSFGFYTHEAQKFVLAAAIAGLLYGSVAIVLCEAAWRLRLPAIADASLRTLGGIALAIAVVVVLACGLCLLLAGWWQFDLLTLLQAHVWWALVGWVGCLVLGVASTVVPMFWQTPRPNAVWRRVTPYPIWISLAVLSLPWASAWQTALYSVAAIAGLGLMLVCLRHLLQARRRFDPAWGLWLGCVLSWAGAAILLLLWMCSPLLENLLSQDSLQGEFLRAIPWWIGVACLIGGGVFPVNAMLGKIIPFLVFLHVRRAIPLGQKIPSMQVILPPQYLRWQARLVQLSLMMLLALPFAPEQIRVAAGLLFSFSQLSMAVLILKCLFSFRRQMKLKPSTPSS